MLDELLADLLAEAFNVHAVAGAEVLNATNELVGAIGVHADEAGALAVLLELQRITTARTHGRGHVLHDAASVLALQHLGDDLPRLLDEHRVAVVDVELPEPLRVVESGPLDGGAA